MSRRRSGTAVHPVPKALSPEELEAELQSAYAPDDLTSNYRFNKVHKQKKPPGPATYAAKNEITRYTAPRAVIGKEERFSSTFAGMFIRAESASEMQCRDSPGPAYHPSFANMPRAPTVSWGSKRATENAARFAREHNSGGRDSNGPAAYHPQHSKILPQATVVNFGKSHRFDSFGGHAFAIHNSPYTGGGDEGVVKLDYVRPASAAFSFGGGRRAPPKGDDPDARPRPRTAFLTHSIRGGLARPATLECGIGPADYNTNQTAIDHNLKKPGMNKFGSAPRFNRPGLVFVSAEHAKADGNVFSPGPMYSSEVGNIRFKQRQPLASLHWCP